MDFQLQHGVPVTATRTKWPFGTMEVGASFALPADDAVIDRARKAASIYAAKHKAAGYAFTVRKQPDGSARCWRVS